MVGLCLIWIPGLASIIKRKSPPSLPEGGGLLVGWVVGVTPAVPTSACENALQIHEARQHAPRMEIALFGERRGSLLRGGAPLAAAFDEAEAPHAFRGPIRRRGRKLEVDEVGAAARRSGMARAPDSAVSGEMGEELQHRDFRAVFRGEPGEAIGALPRAAPASDANNDVGVGREASAPGMKEHNANIWTREGADGGSASRVRWRSKPVGRRRVAAPFTRAQPVQSAGTPSVSHVVDFPRSLGDRQDPYAAGRRPHLFPSRTANGHVGLGKARDKALARIAAILECLW